MTLHNIIEVRNLIIHFRLLAVIFNLPHIQTSVSIHNSATVLLDPGIVGIAAGICLPSGKIIRYNSRNEQKWTEQFHRATQIFKKARELQLLQPQAQNCAIRNRIVENVCHQDFHLLDLV